MYSILKKYGFSKNFNIVYDELPQKKNNNAFQLLMDEEDIQNNIDNIEFIDLYRYYNNSWFN
jgi:hypothetical protein